VRVTGDFVVMALSARANALLGAGDLRGAVAASTEAVDVARRQNQRAQQCEAMIAHVRSLRALEGAGARPAVERLLDETTRLIGETGAERWRPHVHAERGELYRRIGDSAAATRELQEAHRLFVDMDATGYAAAIARMLTA
jgi:hypothetical protein